MNKIDKMFYNDLKKHFTELLDNGDTLNDIFEYSKNLFKDYLKSGAPQNILDSMFSITIKAIFDIKKERGW